MEIQRLIKNFTDRIEPKPEGGFIAHASDSTLPLLEAATRDELQQKIQANITTALASTFPQLGLPKDEHSAKFSFHIEHRPDGSYAIHSADPNTPVIEGGTSHEIESKFVEKLVGFIGNQFMPELAKAVTAPGVHDNVQVFVSSNIRSIFKTNRDSSISSQTDATVMAPAASELFNKTMNGSGNPGFNPSPIAPETNNFWKVVRFVLALIAMGGLMYFYLHRH